MANIDDKEEVDYDSDAFLDDPTDADVTDKSIESVVKGRQMRAQMVALLPPGASDGRVSPEQCAALRESLVQEWSSPSLGGREEEAPRGVQRGPPRRRVRPGSCVHTMVDSRVLQEALMGQLYGLGTSYARFLMHQRLLNAATAVQTCQLAFEAWLNDLCTREEVDEFLKVFHEKFELIFKVSSLQLTYLQGATSEYKNLADSLLSSRLRVSNSFCHLLLATSCLKNKDEKRALDILNHLVRREGAFTSDKSSVYASLCKAFNLYVGDQLQGAGDDQPKQESVLKMFGDFLTITAQLKVAGFPVEEKERVDRIFSTLNPKWTVTETQVDMGGHCKHCRAVLQKEVISNREFEGMKATVMNNLLRGSGHDVFMKSDPIEMSNFLKTLNFNKPFGMVFDGLNIALSKNGRNLPTNLRCKKLIQFIEECKRHYKVQKACVVLRRHLAKGCPVEFGLLQKIACVVSLSDNSLDDPFILYSTLASGPDCFMVSKDRFEDLLSTMGPAPARIFRRWLRCRQILYEDSPQASRQQFLDPANHAIVCQSHPEGFHIPLISKVAKKVDWLCIRR